MSCCERTRYDCICCFDMSSGTGFICTKGILKYWTFSTSGSHYSSSSGCWNSESVPGPTGGDNNA